MASGLLTGKYNRETIAAMAEDDWRKKADDFNEPKLTINLATIDRVKELAVKHNVSTPEMALAWVLHQPAVTAAITGVRAPGQAKQLIRAADVVLSEQELGYLSHG
jgi:aryl-alcohol dehydrogenase-like predicted oxidoreductase